MLTTVLVPVDFSGQYGDALALVSGSAALGVRVDLLHMLDPDLSGEELERQEEGSEFHLQALKAVVEQHGVPTSVVIRRQEALMGGVSMTLLRQSSCPVLIVP